MSDKVFPSSKPAAAAAPTPVKPPLRPPYRPQPHPRRHHRRPRRNYCCCFFFWTILIILTLALLAAISATALYILYHPHRPDFSIPSLRVHRLNLTSSSDSSSNHLATLLKLTVTSNNPNSHITFTYDPFVISAVSASGDVFLGNGTVPGFISDKKDQTVFKNVIVSGSNDLDTDSVKSLKSDLNQKGGVSLTMKLDTKVRVKAGKLSSNKVGIRVTCEGFKAEVPKGKSPSVATTDESKCKVDLRIKIWKFTF